nr:hypothetical protein BaRGS_002535 [Batillaria attramentaria]
MKAGLSLSQLLGQPSVAPPGSYLDKRNCIMGTSNLLTPCGQKRPVIIATNPGRSAEIKPSTKGSQSACAQKKEHSKGTAAQVLPKPASARPIAAATTRPGSSTSSVSKVPPILHSSEVFTSSSPNAVKSQASSLASEGKTHTVHVSLGSTQSLAAFPYIQEMVLPDPQAGTVALKLQTAGVEVKTPASHPKKHPQPAKLLGSGTSPSQALAKKSIHGNAATEDCAAKLQSLARASVHAKQMPKLSGASTAADFRISPRKGSTSGTEGSVAQGPSTTSENQNLSKENQASLVRDTLIPTAGPNGGKVKIKRKRSAPSGSTPPFMRPVAKQRNKENS